MNVRPVARRSLDLALVLAIFCIVTACGVSAAAVPSVSATAASTPSATELGSSSPSTGPVVTPAPPAALIIYGAASLKGALDKLKAAYEADHPGTTLTISTDSSAALGTQIEQGAQADVFLSADATNPQKLVAAGLADGNPIDFAGNLLTIVVPTDNPAAIGSPSDLARSGVKIIAAGNGVPVTRYANQAIGLLARLDGYPTDFAAKYAANVVSKEDNVKAIIAKIELGEGDAGIVYVTDAMASTKVGTIVIPAAANVPATYAGVVVEASPSLAAAHQFLEWMNGPEAQSILAGLGFIAPQP